MCVTPQLERTELLLFISLTGVSMAPKRAGQAEHIHLQPRWDRSEKKLIARTRNETVIHIILVVGTLHSTHSYSSPNRKQAK